MDKKHTQLQQALGHLGFMGSAVLLSFMVGGIILLLAKHNPFYVYAHFLEGIFGKPQFMVWGLIYATPIILTGLSVAIAFKSGLFNIGADGQFIVGTIAAVAVGIFFKLPAIIHIPFALIAGMLAGALWSSIAGWLKVYYGVHEVVVTIMLNWAALYLCNFFTLLPSVVKLDSEVSRELAATASLRFSFLSPILGLSTKTNWGLLIAIIVVILLHYMVHHTTYGFKIRAAGLNQHAAMASGMPMHFLQISAMALSGALAGLGGAIYVMGVSGHTVVTSNSDAYGFDGIVVALMGMGEPIGVLLAAIFYGGLKYGAGKLTAVNTPGELINIVIGLVIYFIGISTALRVAYEYIKKKLSIKRRETTKEGAHS